MLSNHIWINYVWGATNNHWKQVFKPNIEVLVEYYFVLVQCNDLLAGVVPIADRHVDIQNNKIKQQLLLAHWLLDSEECFMTILNWDHHKALVCHEQVKDEQLSRTSVCNQAPPFSFFGLFFFFIWPKSNCSIDCVCHDLTNNNWLDRYLLDIKCKFLIDITHKLICSVHFII